MGAPGRLEGRVLDAITEQQAYVDDLSWRLQHAERVVARANCAKAGTLAHSRADALLLELEAAEHKLFGMMRRASSGAAAASAPRRQQRTATSDAQVSLFDVG